MTETTDPQPDRSPAFDDALQNIGHALLTEDAPLALVRVLETFRDEYRAELLDAAVPSAPATPPTAHGMTMGGHPAMPILVAEYNALVARAAEAEARAAVPSAPADRAATDLRDRLTAALAEEFTPDNNPAQGMRVWFEGPDGWPASRQPTPREVVDEVLDVLRRMADEAQQPETHVVADESDEPEHVDDCPGCVAFTLTGHVAAQPAAVSQPGKEV